MQRSASKKPFYLFRTLALGATLVIGACATQSIAPISEFPLLVQICGVRQAIGIKIPAARTELEAQQKFAQQYPAGCVREDQRPQATKQ